MCDSPLPVSDLQDYEPPLSLWSLVEKYVPDHERAEVKGMLSEGLVEQSLELHEEVNTLMEIWRDYREETQETMVMTRLPEPPAVRERLKQEIRFFVQSIREKAKENGRDAEKILAGHKTNVLDYAFDEKRPCSSASQTSRSSQNNGRETPMSARMTPDRLSHASTVSDEVDSMSEKLNFLKLDEVVQHLRETLEIEIQQLLDDIQFLQGCLEEEAEFRAESRMGGREPTLTDLREERSKLEKDLMVPDVPEGLKDRVKISPPFKKLAPQLQPGSFKWPTPPANSNRTVQNKVSPLKASHQLSIRSDSPPTDGNPFIPHSAGRVNRIRHATLGSAANPSHITIRTSDLPGSAKAKLVSVSVTPKNGGGEQASSSSPVHTPSPPSSGRPDQRPGSANRFRRMVLDCRET